MSLAVEHGIGVVGIGQPWRGDDALGWLVVRDMPERKGVRKLLIGDDATRLLPFLEVCPRGVLLVDAVRSRATPGTLHRLDLLKLLDLESASSLGADPSAPAALRRAPGRLPKGRPRLETHGRVDEPRLSPPALSGLRFSSHSLSPLDAVTLARRLGRKMPAKLVLLGLEGAHYGRGAELSEAVRLALPELTRRLERELDDMPDTRVD